MVHPISSRFPSNLSSLNTLTSVPASTSRFEAYHHKSPTFCVDKGLADDFQDAHHEFRGSSQAARRIVLFSLDEVAELSWQSPPDLGRELGWGYGFVEKQVDPDDRKRHRVVLTAKAVRYVDKLAQLSRGGRK